jgi:hypothetical protein
MRTEIERGRSCRISWEQLERDNKCDTLPSSLHVLTENSVSPHVSATVMVVVRVFESGEGHILSSLGAREPAVVTNIKGQSLLRSTSRRKGSLRDSG